MPAALLWGASFPLALAASTSVRATGERDTRRTVSSLYAANTAGTIVGALATSFVLVPALGSALTQQLSILVASVAAILLVVTDRHETARRSDAPASASRGSTHECVGRCAVSLAAALVLAWSVRSAAARARRVRPVPADARPGCERRLRRRGRRLVDRGRARAERDRHVSQRRQDAGFDVPARHAPAAHARPSRDADPQATALGARDRPRRGNHRGRREHRPRGRARRRRRDRAARAEGREGLLRRARTMASSRARRSRSASTMAATCSRPTREKFDSITSDPLDPWVKGAAALYTREFWELCKSRLNDDGVVTAFVQLYETTEGAAKSEIATFFSAFPHGALFVNTVNGRGYDAVLVGRANDAPIDVDLIEQRLDEPSYERVARSLREVGFDSALDLLGTYAGGAADMSGWLRQGRAQHRSRPPAPIPRGRRPQRSTRRRPLSADHRARRALPGAHVHRLSDRDRGASPEAPPARRLLTGKSLRGGISHRNRAATLPRKRAS